MNNTHIRKTHELGNNKEQVEVLYRKATPLDNPKSNYPGFSPGTTLLKKGTIKEKGRKALPCDIIWERDVEVPMRDGVTIYTDIFRPAHTNETYPSIIAWSPYGKMNSGLTRMKDVVPFNGGIPYHATSGYESFEAPDPAYWCHHGYVILTPDVRGTMMSNGDYEWWGPIAAQDGYDFIEWTASQKWSNGKTSLSGNSQLSILQWFIAALNPPHLTAIAPWEALNDLYRNDIFMGGIKEYGFNKAILYATTGNGLIEDVPAMADKHPLMNTYWESKTANIGNIKAPAYVVASVSNPVHAKGTLQSWKELNMEEKWLRIHNTMEWPDYYQPDNVEDLRYFYDYYLKGIDNNWKETPKVRMSILDPGGKDTVNRVADDYPLPETKYRKLFLNPDKATLSFSETQSVKSVSYDASESGKGKTSFTIRFNKDTELSGFFKLRLWVEAEGSDDMDLFVSCQKLNKKGRALPHLPIPFPKIVRWALKVCYRYGLFKNKIPTAILYHTGPHGKQKVSLRKLDENRSTPDIPIHTFDEFQYLKPGEIVPVEVSLWPTSMRYRAGEQFRLTIGSYNLLGKNLAFQDDAKFSNKGRHIIHTGGQYDSHLLIPEIPYQG